MIFSHKLDVDGYIIVVEFVSFCKMFENLSSFVKLIMYRMTLWYQFV